MPKAKKKHKKKNTILNDYEDGARAIVKTGVVIGVGVVSLAGLNAITKNIKS